MRKPKREENNEQASHDMDFGEMGEERGSQALLCHWRGENILL
jgi:hypothetical protein